MTDRVKDASELDGAWWLQAKPFAWPAEDLSILAPYESTEIGCDLLNNQVFVDAPDWGITPREDGFLCFYHWDIWATRERPPELGEEERRINAMQAGLGHLDDDTRYIRLQTACLHRCWWEFPGNVDLILDGISLGRVNLDGGVSCEPPWSFLLV